MNESMDALSRADPAGLRGEHPHTGLVRRKAKENQGSGSQGENECPQFMKAIYLMRR